jgi:hypothetical protein
VAYLNIVDRQLLSSAASVLYQRGSSPDAACVDVADRKGTEFEGGYGRKLPQAVANMAWAAAVMGGVDSNVHSWLAFSLRGPCGDMLSPEQVSVCFHSFLQVYFSGVNICE